MSRPLADLRALIATGGSAAARVRRWRGCTLLALLPVLGSCGADFQECNSCASPVVAEVNLGLVTADFQNTGRPSVIAASTLIYGLDGNPGTLKLYPIPGGASTAPLVTPNGHDPLYLASADLNGDHIPDVVSASYTDGALAVFFNDPASPGTFGVPLLLPSPGASQLAIADMTGDGQPDIVSADFTVSLFVQLSPGNFAAPVSLYSGGANWVALGDLNGDGSPDVALTDATGVKLLLHAGAASATTFAAPVAVYSEANSGSQQGANLIAIADVNSDGLNDLVITDPGPPGGGAPTVEVLLQSATQRGTFLTPVAYPIQPFSQATSIIVTDVNGDGLPDIVVGGTEGVSVLLQDAAAPGTFLPFASYTAHYAYQIAVADVDGDGRPDILVGTGPSARVVNGLQPNAPGVLLQSSTSPGTFGSLQGLP
jgi:hypothetical protein